MRKKQIKNGYITLLTLLIVGVVGLAITISIVLLGLGTSRSSLAYQQMLQAKAFASTCAEKGLAKIREEEGYVGNQTMTFEGGSCEYSVSSQGGENRTVAVTGTFGTFVRRALITVGDIKPLIVISTWVEVP